VYVCVSCKVNSMYHINIHSARSVWMGLISLHTAEVCRTDTHNMTRSLSHTHTHTPTETKGNGETMQGMNTEVRRRHSKTRVLIEETRH